MIIRPFINTDLTKINEIVENLHPKWFDKNAVRNIPIDVQLGRSYIAIETNEILGFISISSLEGVVWINWMGVDLQHHDKGIGSTLLQHAENELQKLGVKEIKVNTVIEQTPIDGSYDKTIRFYLKNGFNIIEKQEQIIDKEFTYRRGILLKVLKI